MFLLVEWTWEKRHVFSFPLSRFKRYATSVSDDVIETRKRNRGDTMWKRLSTFEHSTAWLPRFSRVSRDANRSPCLIVSKVINFLVYTSFPSSFSFSRQRHLTDSIHTRTRCASKRWDSRVDRQHMAIYRNPLNYLYDPLQHLVTHTATVNANIICYASLGNARRCLRSSLIFFYNRIYFENVFQNVSNVQFKYIVK